MSPGSYALFVITIFNLVSVFVYALYDCLYVCPTVPANVSAVWLQYLISPDFF